MTDQKNTRPNPAANVLRAMSGAFQGVGVSARKAAASFDRDAIANTPAAQPEGSST